ncbi:MAG: hypothetical protein ACRDVC_06600 [Acidimicrobiales bacterium]
MTPSTTAPTSITFTTWFPTMPPGSLQGLLLNTDSLDGSWGPHVTFDDPDGNGNTLRGALH